MVVQKWRCRPTPKRKSLREVIAERRKRQSAKKSKTAVSLSFVVQAEPPEKESDEELTERQGH